MSLIWKCMTRGCDRRFQEVARADEPTRCPSCGKACLSEWDRDDPKATARLDALVAYAKEK